MRTLPKPLLAAALAALLAAGCGRHSWQPAGSLEPDVPVALQLRTEVSAAEIAPGGTLEVRVVLSNPSPRTARVVFTSGCTLVFDVLDASGASVGPEHYVCTLALVANTIGPGGSIEARLPWSGEGFDRSPLPPGDYFVVGRSNSGPPGLASEPIPVRVLAP